MLPPPFEARSPFALTSHHLLQQVQDVRADRPFGRHFFGLRDFADPVVLRNTAFPFNRD
jgi:hypothetical protein